MPLQPVNSAMSISEEIGVLKDEYERATGVNSIMTGQTSPSDRRAMGALQVVNASSSMRIEAMLQTLADTMLNGYARDFVELIYQNASDEELIAITENPNIISVLGTQAQRANTRLDFDIKTSFGTTISAEMEVGQLNNLLGVLAQTGMSDPKLISPLLKDIMLLLRGENAPIEQIDEYKTNEDVVPPNQIYITDITRAGYDKTTDATEKECIGIIPVVTTAANALLAQSIIEIDQKGASYASK